MERKGKTLRTLAVIGAGMIVTLAIAAWFLLQPRIVINSPASQAVLAFRHAAALEAGGDRAQATKAYLAAIDQYHRDIDVSDHVLAYLRLHAAYLKKPCEAHHVEQASWLAAAYEILPVSEQTPTTRRFVVDRLTSCAAEMDATRDDNAFAALSVFEQAAELSERDDVRAENLRKANRIRTRLAKRIELDRPQAALRLYVDAGGKESLLRARELIESFRDSPALWVESDAVISEWARRMEAAGYHGDAAMIRRRLAESRVRMDTIRSEISVADESSLRRMAELSRNEAAALELVRLQLNRDEPALALETMATLRPAGRMTAKAQLLLSRCLLSANEPAAADTVLTTLLQERLPAYHRKARRLAVGENHQGCSDPSVSQTRARLQDDIVPSATIQLGIVRLHVANNAEGAQRRALLERAERAFLAGRPLTSNSVEFLVGLGVIYERLGRTADANALFNRVKRANDPALDSRATALLTAVGEPAWDLEP